MMTLILVFLCIFLLVCYYMIYYERNALLINHIRGPPNMIPFLGHVLHFWPRTATELWDILHNMSEEYYPIFQAWLFTRPHIIIVHPDDAEKILRSTTQHINKGYIYKFLHHWLGRGILTSEGTKWQQRRKMVMPIFHISTLTQFVDIMNEEAIHTKENLLTVKDSVVKDLMSFTSHHMLNIICEITIGTSLRNMNTAEKQYRKEILNIGDIIVQRMFKPLFHSEKLFSFSSLYNKEKMSLKILHEFTYSIIAERKKYHEITGGRYLKNYENDAAMEANGGGVTDIKKKRFSVLDYLLNASVNNKLSEANIREEIDAFIFGGHDTVSIALCFTLLLLAEHKDIQDRARQEVIAVIKEGGDKFTMSMLKNMPYLERCVKESMRLYPSAPFISRVSSEDVKLQSYVVPSGTTMFINIFKINRDPNFWLNPEVFDPDRFISDRIQSRHPYSYIPFSAGPRNCMGQRFAVMELKVMTAALLYNFYLEPIDHLKDIKFRLNIVLRPNKPIRMKFIPIEHTANVAQ